MKKILFIPIAGRIEAKNILRTGILKTLQYNADIHVVVLAPTIKVEEYKKEFDDTNLVFEGIGELPGYLSPLDRFFDRLALNFIDTPDSRFFRKEWLLLNRKKPVRYIISIFFLVVFGNIKLLRKTVHFLDLLFVRDDRYAHFFEKYQPNLVFLPRIDSRLDRSFMRHAKKRRILTVGMVSSWDNITMPKNVFRLLPEKLIVYNNILKQEAVQYLNVPEKNIVVTGWPHYDHFTLSPRADREIFCNKLRIDPHKRIILFASVGSTLNPTEWQILKFLDEAIQKKILPQDCIIIFRFHPSSKTKIDTAIYSDSVVFDHSVTVVTKANTAYTEVLSHDMSHLADSVFHAALTISSGSTMSVDASIFDKPIINIAFDGWKKMPYHTSVRRYFAPHHVHYQSIVKSQGVRIAYSFDELIQYIKMYLNDPHIDHEGRMRIIKEQCYTLDGKSGERIANFILDMMK